MVRLQNSQTTSLRSKTHDGNSTLVPLVGTVGSFPPDLLPRWRRVIGHDPGAGGGGALCKPNALPGRPGCTRLHLAEPLQYRPRRVV